MSALVAHTAQSFSLANAEALVLDPVHANRQASRSALSAAGFGRVIAQADLDSFSLAWSNEPFDLLLADVTENSERIFELVRSIRDGKIGRNPFVHIVLTAWRLEGELIKAALNSGADDMMARPFSADVVKSRVRTLAEARKAFVVTADYVGPDRRRDPPRSSPHLMQVPNVLLARATGAAKAGAAALEDVKQVQKRVEAERMRRGAFKIACSLELLKAAQQASEAVDRELASVEAAAKDVERRVTATPLKVAQKAIADLRAEVEKARGGADAAAALAAIEGYSWTLLETVYPSRDKEELRQEVLSTVATIRSRERK